MPFVAGEKILVRDRKTDWMEGVVVQPMSHDKATSPRVFVDQPGWNNYPQGFVWDYFRRIPGQDLSGLRTNNAPEVVPHAVPPLRLHRVPNLGEKILVKDEGTAWMVGVVVEPKSHDKPDTPRVYVEYSSWKDYPEGFTWTHYRELEIARELEIVSDLMLGDKVSVRDEETEWMEGVVMPSMSHDPVDSPRVFV